MTGFNKFYPERAIATGSIDVRLLRRARVLRFGWIVSTLMLVAGYVIAAWIMTSQ